MSEFIDITSSEFETKSFSVFNENNAGIAADVLIKSVETNTDTATNQPKGYYIIFEKGGEVRQYFNYLDEEDTTSTKYKNARKAIIINCRNTVEMLYDNVAALGQPRNLVDLVDKTMALVKKKIGNKVFLHVNYGKVSRPSGFLRVHGYAPVMCLKQDDIKDLGYPHRDFIYTKPEAPKATEEGDLLSPPEKSFDELMNTSDTEI